MSLGLERPLQGLSKPRLIYRAPEIFEEDIAFFHDLINDPTIQAWETSSAQCLDCGVVDKIVEKCNVLFKDLWGSVDESFSTILSTTPQSKH
jgi:hypothetical protein